MTRWRSAAIYSRLEHPLESQDSQKNTLQVTDYDLLGKMQIFNIQEDFSWGRVETEARKKILKGDAVRCY